MFFFCCLSHDFSTIYCFYVNIDVIADTGSQFWIAISVKCDLSGVGKWKYPDEGCQAFSTFAILLLDTLYLA